MDGARKAEVQLESRPMRHMKGNMKCLYHYITVSSRPLQLVAGFKEYCYQQ